MRAQGGGGGQAGVVVAAVGVEVRVGAARGGDVAAEGGGAVPAGAALLEEGKLHGQLHRAAIGGGRVAVGEVVAGRPAAASRGGEEAVGGPGVARGGRGAVEAAARVRQDAAAAPELHLQAVEAERGGGGVEMYGTGGRHAAMRRRHPERGGRPAAGRGLREEAVSGHGAAPRRIGRARGRAAAAASGGVSSAAAARRTRG